MISKQILSDLTNFDFSDILYTASITNGIRIDQITEFPLNIGNRIFPNLSFCDVSLYHDTSDGILYSTILLHGGIVKDDNGNYFTDPSYYIFVLDEFDIIDIKKCWLIDNTQSYMGNNEIIGTPTQSVFSADTVITIDSGISVLHISIGGLDLTSLPEDPFYTDSSGPLQVWGDNYSGQLGLGTSLYTSHSSPTQLGSTTDFAEISYPLVIKANGSLYSWGINNYGQLGQNTGIGRSSPIQVGNLTTQKKIFGGKKNCFAINNSNILQSWGYNTRGQLGINDTINRSSPTQVGGLTNQDIISHSDEHCLAIKEDGSLWSWGKNSDGQLGIGNRNDKSSPVQIGSLTTQIQIAAGQTSSYGIQDDYSLWAQGGNGEGQLGLNNIVHRSSPTQVGLLTDWLKVSSNSSNSVLAIKTNNSLQAWGYNSQGQLGTNDLAGYGKSKSSPVQVGGLTDWNTVESAMLSSVAIKEDGTLQTWGYNYYGTLGIGDTSKKSSPVQVGSLTQQTKISIFESSVFATTASQILPIMENIDLGVGDNYIIKKDLYKFNPVSGYYSKISGVDDIFACFGHGICKYNENIVMMFGGGTNQAIINFQDNTIYKSDFTEVEQFGSPAQITILESNTGDTTWFGGGVLEEQLTDKSSGQDFGDTSTSGEDGLWLKVQHTGNLSSLLLDLTNQFSARCAVHLPNETTTIFDDSLTPPFYIELAGEDSIVYVYSKQPKGTRIKQVLTFNPEYTLWSWGSNSSGVLGLNDLLGGGPWFNNRSSPTQVGNLTDQSKISEGGPSVLSIKLNGTLQSWGENYYGVLGLGNRVNRSSPTQVGSLTDWSLIACGYHFAAAIKTGGSLWVWGLNYYGNIGNNSRIASSSPIQIGSDINWSKVGSGSNETFAIKTNGTLWTWGYNGSGQLGLNDGVNRSSPTQVGGLTDQSLISSRSGSVFSVKTDGTLWTWGYNGYGILGQNNIINRSSPTQVGGDIDQKYVSVGSNHILATKTDGSLWAQGRNTTGGQLGQNDIIDRSSPVQIGNDFDQNTISAGVSHSLATKINDILYSWGANNLGQLGKNDLSSRSSPTQVGLLTGQTLVECIGGNSSFAIRSD